MGWNTTHAVHRLKILPKYFAAVLTGHKTFEIRAEDDKHFNEGDNVIFREYDDKRGEYTAASVIARITYVLRDVPEYGLKDGFCIFGFTLCEK